MGEPFRARQDPPVSARVSRRPALPPGAPCAGGAVAGRRAGGLDAEPLERSKPYVVGATSTPLLGRCLEGPVPTPATNPLSAKGDVQLFTSPATSGRGASTVGRNENRSASVASVRCAASRTGSLSPKAVSRWPDRHRCAGTTSSRSVSARPVNKAAAQLSKGIVRALPPHPLLARIEEEHNRVLS